MGNRYGCRKRSGPRGEEVGLDFCEECLKQQQRIDRLEDENKSLKAQLKYREKKSKEGFFGNSPPSSKRYIKPNSKKDDQEKQGGAKKGHNGNAGRHTFSEAEADEVIELKVCDEDCPNCGGKLQEEYRNAPVKHADETGWRTNGHSGYAWLFCTDELSLFQFGKTRSSQVVRDMLGTDPLPGVLIVDRYPGYNKAPCKIQYCYEHLKRDLDKLGDKNPDSAEVTCFVTQLRPLLVEAMKLRNRSISKDVFEIQASELKEKILALIRAPAKHFGIQTYQDIFKDNEHRLFHWADSWTIIAENNTAERELRPSIIARKVSFGSQSKQGAETRSILMSILHTAVKRLDDQAVHHWFCEALEALLLDPSIHPFSLLPPDSHS